MISLCVVFGVAVVRKPTSCYIDVKVFNPHVSTNRSSSPSAIYRSRYRRYEKIKKRSFEDRIREVEHSSFIPLIFSATGGMALAYVLPPSYLRDGPTNMLYFGLDLLSSLIFIIAFSQLMFKGFLFCSKLTLFKQS